MSVFSWPLALALTMALTLSEEDVLVHRGDGFELSYPRKNSVLQPASAAVPFQLQYRKNSLIRLETEPLTQPIALTDETYAEILREVQLERLQQRIRGPVLANRIRHFQWGVAIEFEYELPARNGKKNQKDRVVEIVTTVDRKLFRFTHWIPDKDWKRVSPSFNAIVASFKPDERVADVERSRSSEGAHDADPTAGAYSVRSASRSIDTLRRTLERDGLSTEELADLQARLAKMLGWKAYLSDPGPAELDEIGRTAEAAFASKPSDIEALQARAWADFHHNRTAEMEEMIQAASALDPNSPENHLLHAIWYRFNPERSSELLARALETDADYVPALFVKAEAERENGDLAEAQQLLERAVTLEPTFSRAQLALGELLVEVEDYDRAVPAVRAAAAAAPEDVVVRFRSGVALRRAGRIDEAIEAYRATLRIDDGLPEAHYNLAVLFLNEKRQEDSGREHFQRFVELAPQSERADRVRAWLDAHPARR